MDLTERERRRATAAALVDDLAARGIVGVATTFIDNSGIARVKAVPLRRLPHVAAWGVGFSTSFDRFRFDDWIAASGDGTAPVGDLRLMPDVRRVVPLAAQPGWAWTPSDRYSQTGEPHPQCGRLLLQRLVDELAAEGISVKSAFEVEWVVSAGPDDNFTPGVIGPGYGMSRLIDSSDYSRDVLSALIEQGVTVEQFHPEYAAGQLELAVASEAPVDAADTSVLVRNTVRAVGSCYGLRTSFSPKVAVPGVGNGGHVHLSLWRDGQNLMSGGAGPYELTKTGSNFAAGILDRLPALLTIGAPSPVSYLRLVPSHWAGAYVCWGLENREAALRMVTGSTGQQRDTANIEIKCFDLLANPYLVLAALLAAGCAGMSKQAELPPPVDVDPAALDESVLSERGIRRLPTTLREAVDAFSKDEAMWAALGEDLCESIVAIRESELELFADASEQDLAAATRWAH